MKPAATARVSIAMRISVRMLALLVVMAAACGGKQQTSTGDDELVGSAASAGPVRDTRTEIEKRRDAACDVLAPRITTCAVEDAKKDLAAGKVTQKQFAQDTASGVQRKNTEEFAKACKAKQYSSRQVRVLEICPKAESECDAMLSCLDNLNHP